jgi:ankyrin repeat protein
MMANLESRIKTSAERELVARNMIRKELVEKAENNDIEGIKEMLTMIAEEAEKTNQRPRASVEVRNDAGQSLLSIATQHNYVELASFLLTYWKTVNENRIDFISHDKEDDISPEAKVFKANPNSRDLKGWTCVCIAVFHNATKVLPLLLENGGDPNIKSSYNKNAWDLAKDELDAAEKVVKSNAEIRQVLIDYDQTNNVSSTERIFTSRNTKNSLFVSDFISWSLE